MRYHPDRQSDQSPAAREQAEFRMRELNAAWDVLRSPARRAEYDARLRGDVPVWQQSRPRPKRTTPVVPHAAPLEPDRPGRPSPAAGWRLGPILAIVVAVVAVLGFAAWATASSDDDPPDVRVETGTPYEEGTCVVLTPVQARITALPTECSSIGSMVIREIVDLGRPCPQGMEAFDVQVEERTLCLRPA